MSSNRSSRRRAPLAALGLSSLIALSGCASLGGNVRGSFSCAAPDGICAPSSTIDDRALAMMTGDPSDADALPARNFQRSPDARVNRAEATQPRRPATGDPGRTQEKVLRIVFQPYIDERGYLHEASAVHAVVASGEWRQALIEGPPATSPQAAAMAGSSESLADAIDRVDPPFAGTSPAFGAPDPAAVAAARARKADPIATIKADVAARLASRTATPPPAPKAEDLVDPPSAPEPETRPGALAAKPGKPSARNAEESPVGISAAGAIAVDRVKSDPTYQGIAAGVAKDAREAAVQNGAPQPTPTQPVKAANFPAAVPEDK